MENQPYPVYEFRPLEEMNNLLRYNNGSWKEDDGEWDLAFVGRDPDWFPMALGVSLPYYDGILWKWCQLGDWGTDVPRHPGGNPWHYMTRNGKSWGERWDREAHPNTKAHDTAMRKCVKKYGCANGRGPELSINNAYITLQKLRIRDTGEIVEFPDLFMCIHCGRLDWRAVERELREKRRKRP